MYVCSVFRAFLRVCVGLVLFVCLLFIFVYLFSFFLSVLFVFHFVCFCVCVCLLLCFCNHLFVCLFELFGFCYICICISLSLSLYIYMYINNIKDLISRKQHSNTLPTLLDPGQPWRVLHARKYSPCVASEHSRRLKIATRTKPETHKTLTGVTSERFRILVKTSST